MLNSKYNIKYFLGASGYQLGAQRTMLEDARTSAPNYLIRFIKSYDVYHTLLRGNPLDYKTHWTYQVRPKVECTTNEIRRAKIYLWRVNNASVKHHTHLDGHILLQTLMSPNTKTERDCTKRKKNTDTRLSAHIHLNLTINP